jgi:trk system potassium uptake protein TrkH
MEPSVKTLSYAVRPAILRYYLSRLALVLAGLTLVPLVAALVFDEARLAGSLAITVAVLVMLWLPGRHAPAPRRLQVNEALATVALTFVLAPLSMVLPFTGQGLNLEDAVFESVSAITTTGLSTISEVDDYSPALLLLRAWMQWYGGLGIAVFSLALALGHLAGARRLAGIYRQEDLHASTRTYARQVLSAYLVLTVVAVLILWWSLGDGLQALLHALAAVSTGGFSGYEQSLADMPSRLAPYLTLGAALLGALPLILYYQIASRRGWKPAGDPEWWALPLTVALVGLLLVLILHVDDGMGWSDALHHGMLLGASAQTTAGFSTLTVGELSDSAKLWLIVAMLGGGSIGSTAGGIKLLRLLILAKLVAFILRRTTMPRHAVSAMRLGGRSLQDGEIQRALVVILLFVLTVVLSWMIMVASGQDVLDALFEVVSAVGTVGLSTGIVSHDLATGLKLMLCLDMLLGRLEILALLVLLYPPTWLGRRIDNQ